MKKRLVAPQTDASQPVFIHYNPAMRKLIFPLLLLLGIVFVFINLAEVEAVVETLQRGDWRIILLAIGVQAVLILAVASCFRNIYRGLGLDEEVERLALLVASANFTNTVAPTGGVGGIAVFVADGRRRGYSSARVTVAGALVVLFDYIAFLCILTLGLIVLFRRNHLGAAELSASGVLFTAVIVIGFLVYLGMRSGEALSKALTWMARQVNRFLWLFIHREYLSEHRAHSFAYEAADGLCRLRQKPEILMMAFLLSVINKSLLILILSLVFIAFKVPFTTGTIIGGFSIGYLFLIVSPTPAGIGVVEGAMTLGLRSLNVPLGEATVITLAYRGITFWLPLAFGALAFRWLSLGKEEVEAPT